MNGLPEGFVLDQPVAPPAAPPVATLPPGFVLDMSAGDQAADVGKSLGVGVGKGTIGLAGFIGDMSEFGAIGLDKAISGIGKLVGQDLSRDTMLRGRTTRTLSDLITEKPAAQVNKLGESPIGSAVIRRGVEGVTGEFYKPKTTAGQYAETVGEFVPAAIAGPGTLTRRILAQAIAPGVVSEAAGQATKGTAYEPYARFGGAVLGATAPAIAGRVVNPLQPSAERQAAATVLRNEGVPVSAGEEAGAPMLRALESPFGGNPEGQLAALTEAAMRRAGEPGGRATRQNVDAMFDRLGRTFDQLGARNTAALDVQGVADLRTAIDEYRGIVSAPNRAPAVQNYLEELGNVARQNGGTIPGEAYNSLRSRMERTARSAPPEVADAIRGIREAMDGMMERSIAVTNPNDFAAWQTVRNQYRNALVIERAATTGGENAGLGLLTPGALSQAVTSLHGRRNRSRGRGDFSELSDAADALLRALPNSGTPVRSAAAVLPTTVGAGLGGLLGLPGGPAGSTLGAMAGAGMGQLAVTGGLRIPAVQNYLAGRYPWQNFVRNPSSTGMNDAVMQAIARARLLQPVPQGQ